MYDELTNPWVYLSKAVILLIALPAHEASHALAAYLLGDDTAKMQGRITLNPLKHLDPLGTIMMLIPGSFIGWAKPTPFNPVKLHGSRSLGSALIYLAGPASNFVQAGLFGLLLKVLLVTGAASETAVMVLVNIIFINLILAIFNLLPLPPLDGFGALSQIAAGEFKYTLHKLQALGMPILFGVLILDRISGLHLISGFIFNTATQILAPFFGASD